MDYSPPGSSVHGIFQARSGLPFPSHIYMYKTFKKIKDITQPGAHDQCEAIFPKVEKLAALVFSL